MISPCLPVLAVNAPFRIAVIGGLAASGVVAPRRIRCRSQAFVYASLAVAPLMVVTPILQLSLVFRLFLSQLINRDHEVMNTAVLVGAFTAVLGSMLVSLDSDELTGLLGLPPSIADCIAHASSFKGMPCFIFSTLARG